MVLYLRPVLLLPGCVIVTCILLALNLFLILPPVQLPLFPVTSGLDLGEWVLCIVSVTCPNNCNLTFSICRCYLVSCTCAVCVFLPLLCFYSFCYLYQEPVSVWKLLVSFTCHLHLCFSVFGASWVCGSQLFLSCTVVLSPVVTVLCFRASWVCCSQLSVKLSLYGRSSDRTAGVSVSAWLPEVRRTVFMWVLTYNQHTETGSGAGREEGHK